MVILILTMALTTSAEYHGTGVGSGSGTGGVSTHEFRTVGQCVAVGEAWESRMKLLESYHKTRNFYLCVDISEVK